MSNVGGRQMAGGTGGTRTAFLVVAALLAGAAPAAGSRPLEIAGYSRASDRV